MITIEATLRDVKVKPKLIRKEGRMPAVFYGKGVETTSISVETSLFIKALREAGESTVVTLSVDGKKLSVLIHDTVRHAIRGDFMHADFLVVPMNEAIEVSVPVVFTGEAPATKLGAVIVKVMHEVTVSALPADLPHEITVDLGKLTDVHSHIKISDLKLGKGIKIIDDASEIIVSATEAEKEEVAEVAATPATPEVAA